jgi:hypothetical protein
MVVCFLEKRLSAIKIATGQHALSRTVWWLRVPNNLAKRRSNNTALPFPLTPDGHEVGKALTRNFLEGVSISKAFLMKAIAKIAMPDMPEAAQVAWYAVRNFKASSKSLRNVMISFVMEKEQPRHMV